MPSTIQLKFTYVIHLLSILFLPLVGLALTIIVKLLVATIGGVLTGGQGDIDPQGVGDIFFFIGIIMGILYLITLVGLIIKSNFLRLIGIILNSLTVLIFGYGLFSTITSNSPEFQSLLLGTLMILIYLFPVYTLALHDETKKLF